MCNEQQGCINDCNVWTTLITVTQQRLHICNLVFFFLVAHGRILLLPEYKKVNQKLVMFYARTRAH